MKPVIGRRGMVATAEPNASQVGAAILREGGNAVDAAVAVAFALGVTLPEAGNLGGGGFLLLRLRDGRATAIDYRETAPERASRNVYLDAAGNLIPGEGGSLVGYRAAGVPGTVAGMDLVLKKYGSGRFTWERLIEPARRLAAEGFSVRPALARSLTGSRKLLDGYSESRRIYLNGGAGWKAGERLRLPDLAETLTRLQKRGPREFYEGETAKCIVGDIAAHNGLMTAADLRGYAARERTPLRGTYRGNQLFSMPPPSSGGIALFQMLGMLESFDLKGMRPDSPQYYHLLIEAMRRAFADRAVWLGDPDFVRVPVAELTAPDYIKRLRDTISPGKASPSSEVPAGTFPGYKAESLQTTHFTVVDGDGNAVSNTYTLNGAFGSGVVAAGTGILLNNEMDDFAAKPGTPNLFGLIQGERNVVGPRKRPLSSMTPTIVCRPNGELWFTAGSPGGPTIINTVLQVLLNTIDHGMDIQAAVDHPRVHHQWLPDEIAWERNGLFPTVRADLEARGHKFAEKPRKLGDAQAIRRDKPGGDLSGGSDSRYDGLSVGV